MHKWHVKEAARGWGWMWAPWNVPVRSAELRAPAGAWIPPTQVGSHSHLGQVQLHSFGWAWTPNVTTTAGHKDLTLTFHSASWRGCSLGGWAVHSWKPQLGIWFQKWTAPGSEHDLVKEWVWAPGLTSSFHIVSSVWSSLLKDWKFAHVCGVLDASIDTSHSKRKDN